MAKRGELLDARFDHGELSGAEQMDLVRDWRIPRVSLRPTFKVAPTSLGPRRHGFAGMSPKARDLHRVSTSVMAKVPPGGFSPITS